MAVWVLGKQLAHQSIKSGKGTVWRWVNDPSSGVGAGSSGGGTMSSGVDTWTCVFLDFQGCPWISMHSSGSSSLLGVILSNRPHNFVFVWHVCQVIIWLAKLHHWKLVAISDHKIQRSNYRHLAFLDGHNVTVTLRTYSFSTHARYALCSLRFI